MKVNHAMYLPNYVKCNADYTLLNVSENVCELN